jgi:hypothetical protein
MAASSRKQNPSFKYQALSNKMSSRGVTYFLLKQRFITRENIF